MRGEGRAERVDAATLRSDPRQQEDRVWHQRTQAAESLWTRRAADGPDERQTTVAELIGAEDVRDLGEPLVQWASVGIEVLEIGRAGVRSVDE
jgi:hypothetical protein